MGYFEKDTSSSLKLLQEKKLPECCAQRLAVEAGATAKSSSTPHEQHDRTMNSRTLGPQKARELRLSNLLLLLRACERANRNNGKKKLHERRWYTL